MNLSNFDFSNPEHAFPVFLGAIFVVLVIGGIGMILHELAELIHGKDKPAQPAPPPAPAPQQPVVIYQAPPAPMPAPYPVAPPEWEPPPARVRVINRPALPEARDGS